MSADNQKLNILYAEPYDAGVFVYGTNGEGQLAVYQVLVSIQGFAAQNSLVLVEGAFIGHQQGQTIAVNLQHPSITTTVSRIDASEPTCLITVSYPAQGLPDIAFHCDDPNAIISMRPVLASGARSRGMTPN